jgi:hypothetical protein
MEADAPVAGAEAKLGRVNALQPFDVAGAGGGDALAGRIRGSDSSH